MLIANPKNGNGKQERKKFYKIAALSALVIPFLFVLSAKPAHAWSFFGAVTGLADIGANVVGWIVFAISYLITSIVSLFIVVLTYFIGIILQLNGQVVNSLAVQSGFTVTLAVANLGFVLGIIVIAIMTIIRNETYGMKQILWKLVVAAILVNFSLVIGGVIINISNIFTTYFMAALPGGGGGASGYFAFSNALSGAFTTTATHLSDTSSTIGSADITGGASQLGGSFASMLTPIFGLVFTVVMLAMVLITLGTFLFMLLVRYVELSILLILMPLVWLFWVFPKLSHLWDKWWNEFIRWTFFAPIVMFFVYLAISTAHTMSAANSSGGWTTLAPGLSANGYVSPTGNALSSFIGSFINTIAGQALQMLVVIGLMVGGMVAADKLSITGAGAAMRSMKGESGFGKWMKNRGRAGGLAGWRNRGKIGNGIKAGASWAANTRVGRTAGNLVGVAHKYTTAPIVGAIKKGASGIAGSRVGATAAAIGNNKGVKAVTGAVGGAASWTTSRLASKAALAVHPYLSNKEEVEEARRSVPESTSEVRANLANKNMSTADTFAHLGELIRKGKLEEGQMIRGQLASKWKDDHEGAAGDYGWGKESDEANVAFGGDKKVRETETELKKVIAGGGDAAAVTAATDKLTAAVHDFGSKLEKKDMPAMGKSGALMNDSHATKQLMRYFMDQAPQLAASAMSGMKGSKPREYQEKYNEEIDKHKKEIEADPKISAAQKVELVLRLDNPDPKKPGIRQQFNRSASRYVEGIATGGGGGGGSPAPGH